MSERLNDDEGSLGQERERNPEEQLPASLAIKDAVRTAFEHRVPGAEVRGKVYTTQDKRRAIVWHDSKGYLASFTGDAFVVGSESDSEPEKSQLTFGYRLIDQDEEIELYRTDWPGREAADENQDVSEAEAKRLLIQLAQMKPRR